MSFINTLQAASEDRRVELIVQRYEENILFFKEHYRQLYDFIVNNPAPFEINVTKTFFSIIRKDSDVNCHPEPLDLFAETLGGWNHGTWMDFNNFPVLFPEEKYHLHFSLVKKFHTGLLQAFPEFRERIGSGRVNLKELDFGEKFSPTVSFVGVFHGLHIEHYLSRAQVDSVLFIEPEPERFEVSCYFMDWRQIHQRFGRIYLSLDPDPNSEVIKNFFVFGRVTPSMWLRVLPGYVSDFNGPIVSMLNLLHNNAKNMFTSLDIDLEGMKNGLRNLELGIPLLSRRPELSKESKIVVVGAGPSLHHDLRWIKKNRKELILLAVHSAVNPLRKAGITPDFQFALEMHLDRATLDRLDLLPDVPLVLISLTNEEMLACSSYPLLVGLGERSNVVDTRIKVIDAIPSTGSFCVAVALHFRPAVLYLIGLDLGFRRKHKQHAKNEKHYGRQDQNSRKESSVSSPTESLVQANFSGTDPVWTTTFFTNTRFSIERALSRADTLCYNMSDGAAVKGALPLRSASMKMVANSQRDVDLELMRKSFVPAEKGKNWCHYDLSGESVIRDFMGELLACVTLRKFEWLAFARAVDMAPLHCLEKSRKIDPGNRAECYFRLVLDWMMDWYRVVLFCDTLEEAGRVYDAGLSLLRELSADLDWPRLPSAGVISGHHRR